MRRLRYTTAALNDLTAIAAYIEEASGSKNTARVFTGRLRDRCRKLASLPGPLGQARPELKPQIRSVALANYVIFFRYLDGVFEVVNVIEGHRDIESIFKSGPD